MDIAGLYASAAFFDVVLWLPLSIVAVGALNGALLFGMGIDDLDRSYVASVGGMATLRGLLFIARVPSCILLPAAWFLSRALESSATSVSSADSAEGNAFAISAMSLVSLLALAAVVWILKITAPWPCFQGGQDEGYSFAAELIDVVLPRHAASCLSPKVYAFVMGPTEWVPTTYEVETVSGGSTEGAARGIDGGRRVNHPFHRRTAAFYEDSLPTRKWFLAVGPRPFSCRP